MRPHVGRSACRTSLLPTWPSPLGSAPQAREGEGELRVSFRRKTFVTHEPRHSNDTASRSCSPKWARRGSGGCWRRGCCCAAAGRSGPCWPRRWCGPGSASCGSSTATSSRSATCSGRCLFDEDDVASHLPKAVTAAAKLRKINSEITIEPVVADIDHANILALADGVDLILDGTDNFEVRFLINDASLELGIPWIYAGVIGSHGQTMTIFPGETACLRCLIESVPDPGSVDTCDTAGVLGPAVNVIASLEAVDAIKILSGRRDDLAGADHRRRLGHQPAEDERQGSARSQRTAPPAKEASACGCPASKARRRPSSAAATPSRCRRRKRRASRSSSWPKSCAASARSITTRTCCGSPSRDPDFEVTVFRDGRAIIKGTDDITRRPRHLLAATSGCEEEAIGRSGLSSFQMFSFQFSRATQLFRTYCWH